jgi:broad specificity phosphatase PhoE
LTELGKQQCLALRDSFPDHGIVSLVVTSPLRRALETTILAFAPTLARPEVPCIAQPLAQEINVPPCDTGFSREETIRMMQDKFGGQDLGFDLDKVDYSAVEEDWNSKVGYWSADPAVVQKRAADMRAWLFTRPESRVGSHSISLA